LNAANKDLHPRLHNRPLSFFSVILSERSESKELLLATGRMGGKPRTAIGTASGTSTAICRLLLMVLLFGPSLAAAVAQFPITRESLLDKQAPAFTRPGLNGATVDLASLRGKVVLLNFWATWCGPCEVEMPIFAGWQNQYGSQGFQVIGISMDDDPALARKLSTKLKLNYPSAMGDEKLGELYGGVLGLPLSYLIDRNGIVRAKIQGETDPKTIEEQLKALLNQH
jgi:peroxiredoxin